MRSVCGGLALVVLLFGSAARGQFGFGLDISRTTRPSSFSLTVSRLGGPYVVPYPVVPRLTVVQVYAPPPRPIVLVVERRPPPVDDDPLTVPPPPLEPDPPPMPGFRPVRPQERDEARKPVAPPAPRPAKPLPSPRPIAPAPPEPDPRAESDRLIRLGKEAFAAREYARAARRFRQAAAAAPAEGLPYFLLAQAEFALGKYDEAVAAIQEGMRRRPDWPTAPLRPIDLYDGNAADLPEHLRRLDAARARHSADPTLLFLGAYQLWLDGRRDEAVPLFEKAAAVAADPSFALRFLRERPTGPAL